jgi:hypothetical protein
VLDLQIVKICRDILKQKIAKRLELRLGTEDHVLSTADIELTHKFDIDAYEKVGHDTIGGNNLDVLVKVEKFDVSEEELLQHQPEDSIYVVDIEDQVCICVDPENITQDTVCICIGKDHGELTKWSHPQSQQHPMLVVGMQLKEMKVLAAD